MRVARRPGRLLIAAVAVALAIVALIAVLVRSPSRRPDLRVVDGTAGPMVVTGSGLTVYAYLPDSIRPSKSVCTGDCANDWPPVLVPKRSARLAGLSNSSVGVAIRDDGTRQLTLAGYPLYTFAGDRRAGEITGESVGNKWFAVAPDGSFLALAPASFDGRAQSGAPVLTVRNTRAGRILADSAGQTLYVYKDDGPTRSACIAEWCNQDWPALTVPALPRTVPGISAPIGTLRRPDGTLQLTVGGHPVYVFAGDSVPGDLRGFGIGKDWYPLDPTGSKVTG